MKTAAIEKLRRKVAADQSVYGLWVTLESPSLSEMAVALGLDWIVIDAEHGHLGWKEILEHIRATVRSETVALVRIAELNASLIKRVLDIGADGVVVPWVETADQLKQAVAFAKYPPDGLRGIGGERATGWGQCLLEHTREANEHVLVVPIIETVTAGQNVEALCEVGGTELFFFGPADYSSTAGHRGQWEGPGVAAELLAIKDTLRAHGKHCGIMSTSVENLIERRQQDFRMLGVGSDTGLLLRSLHAALGVVGQDRRILPSLTPEANPLPITPLPHPPESLRPDRQEVMNQPDKNSPAEIAPGVLLDCLVGAHNGARNLTTNQVTFKPGAKLAYHNHPVSESTTVRRQSVEGKQIMNARKFIVTLTADFYDSGGAPKFRDLGLSVLTEHPHIEHGVIKEHRKQIGADQIGDAQGVVVLTPAVTSESVSKADNLLVIARFGVGYDAVDVKACTAADVLVAITTGAVDRSVAEATIGWMIALSHNLRIKDGLVRTGQWDERSKYMGSELRDRTLGVVGLGGIARKTIELLGSFGMKQPLAFDPFVSEETAAKCGARLVSLEDLFRQADFVSVHCPLNEQTRSLIGTRELALMKPDAYFLNTARGGIVDEDALYDALENRSIAGAALDCFAQEPVTSPHRFGKLENVLLAPHSIAWTDELFRDIGRAACQVMVDLSLRNKPRGVLNPEVFEQSGFQKKWERLCNGG